jgi:hypothetical protein
MMSGNLPGIEVVLVPVTVPDAIRESRLARGLNSILGGQGKLFRGGKKAGRLLLF